MRYTGASGREGYGMYMTVIYSLLHLLVDGVCALAMFGFFLLEEDKYFLMLVYNFCGFALQMPFGILLDMLNAQRRKRGQGPDPAFWTAAVGVLFTVTGALTHPAVLGVGNALFHVGGGVGCFREDAARGWKGRGLGVFVAPGAIGLYLGMLLARQGAWKPWFCAGSVLMAALCICVLRYGRCPIEERQGRQASHQSYGLALVCLLVVILRSYVGMAVSFPWKTGGLAGLLAVLAIAGGKTAGGFAAARCGALRTAVASLAMAAVCYLFSSALPAGLAALFLFNMTMPITLWWMMHSMPELSGFAFGFLTFALFLGFLPGYFGLLPEEGMGIVGCAGSVLSLFLLWLVGRRRE